MCNEEKKSIVFKDILKFNFETWTFILIAGPIWVYYFILSGEVQSIQFLISVIVESLKFSWSIILIIVQDILQYVVSLFYPLLQVVWEWKYSASGPWIWLENSISIIERIYTCIVQFSAGPGQADILQYVVSLFYPLLQVVWEWKYSASGSWIWLGNSISIWLEARV